MKWVFLTRISSMEQLIKSESLSLYLRRYKENENNCTVSASQVLNLGQDIKFQIATVSVMLAPGRNVLFCFYI